MLPEKVDAGPQGALNFEVQHHGVLSQHLDQVLIGQAQLLLQEDELALYSAGCGGEYLGPCLHEASEVCCLEAHIV